MLGRGSHHWLLQHELFDSYEFRKFKEAVAKQCAGVAQVQKTPTLSTADQRTLQKVESIQQMLAESHALNITLSKSLTQQFELIDKQQQGLEVQKSGLYTQVQATDLAVDEWTKLQEEFCAFKLAHLPAGPEADAVLRTLHAWRVGKVLALEGRVVWASSK